MNRAFLVGGVVSLLFLTSIWSKTLSSDVGPIAAAMNGFHDALHRGEKEAAAELLAPDAVILESGESQTRAEYEREHLAEDIAFASATKTERSPLIVRQEGDVAWTTATTKTTGTFHGRKINTTGVELMGLTKDNSGWRIRAIHWSSHEAKREN